MMRIIPLLGLTAYVAAADPSAEILSRFFYDGKPIKPTVIELFNPWISDSQLLVMSVDLAVAQSSNQCFDTPLVDPSGWIETAPRKDGSSFAYKFIGTLPSHVIVLHTVDCGGGSGRFEDLMLLSLTTETVWNQDGSTRSTPVLHAIRQIGLGDRAEAAVKIVGDRIHVERSQSLPNELHDPLDIADPLSATASAITAQP